jgi:hypothetical protein
VVSGSDGSFFSEDRVVFDLLETSATEWLDDDPLHAGSYFIHVSGTDRPCWDAGLCPYREWSAIQRLVIPTIVRLLSVRVETVFGTYLRATVRWSSNAREVVVAAEGRWRGKRVWRGIDRSTGSFGRASTSYIAWNAPSRLRGAKVALRFSVSARGITRTLSRSVRIPR